MPTHDCPRCGAWLQEAEICDCLKGDEPDEMVTICVKCGGILDDAEDETELDTNGFKHVECPRD